MKAIKLMLYASLNSTCKWSYCKVRYRWCFAFKPTIFNLYM